MGRNILLITTDQMRFDALGCNGGIVARTPVIDALAAEGINIQMISTSEIKISVVVDEKYLELAVRALHQAFDLALEDAN